jgi:hypothetical protein
MARPRLLPAFLALATIALTTPARAVTIPPDSTSEPLSAIGCFFASGSLDNISDLTCPPTNCLQDCNAGENQAKDELHITTVDVGRRYTESTVYTDFTVEAASDGAATALDGTISYDVAWSGGWTLAGILPGFNDVKSTMSLILWDQTAGGGIVAQAPVHSLDASSAGSLPELPVDVGVGWDHGEVTNSLASKVIRGHTYRIGLKVRIEGKGALNADIDIDYLTFADWGLKWNELRVAVGPDLAEEIARLEKRVDQLEEDLRHHTHTYLTGKGEGHNNTVASTSEAIIVDNGPPSDDESKVLPPETDKKPLPAPSVLVTTAPNPFNPVATITYALPADMPVTLRVYDAQGRLVATLVDSDEAGGEHKATFNASGLASGVYYYRINAGAYSETRKITLLK